MNTNSSNKSHKRKGSTGEEEYSYASVHRSVVFSPPASSSSSFRSRSQYSNSNSNSNTREETQCHHHLKALHKSLLRRHDKKDDPVLNTLQTKLLKRSTTVTQNIAQHKKQHAANILQQLADKIETATTQHQLLTAEQQQLQLQLAALQQQVTQYTGQVQEAADQQHELMQEIAGYANQANQLLAELQTSNHHHHHHTTTTTTAAAAAAMMKQTATSATAGSSNKNGKVENDVDNINGDDAVENHRSVVVDLPNKLRYQLSLYASCTGIKWEYDDEKKKEDDKKSNHHHHHRSADAKHNKTPVNSSSSSSKAQQVLQGEMTIPSEQLIRRFVLDPAGLTRFEIAHQLWDMMEGNNINNNNNIASMPVAI